MSRPPFTTTWIEPGKVLCGSIPTSPTDIEQLKGMGIQAVLTLTRRGLDCPGMDTVLDALLCRHYPIPDGGLADDGTMLNAAAFMGTCVYLDKPVYVHCRGGIGRTGTVLLAYYVLYGHKGLVEARDLVRVRRNYEGNASAVDQGSPQREWIDRLETMRKEWGTKV